MSQEEKEVNTNLRISQQQFTPTKKNLITPHKFILN